MSLRNYTTTGTVTFRSVAYRKTERPETCRGSTKNLFLGILSHTFPLGYFKILTARLASVVSFDVVCQGCI